MEARKFLDRLLEAHGLDVEAVIADCKVGRTKASATAKKVRSFLYENDW
jgi:hypothetical protein